MKLIKYKNFEKELTRLSSDAGYMQQQRHPSFYLERMRLVMRELSNPEKKFKYIHIGGTAGKGSVTVMLHTILHHAGRNVGSYISPHVTTLAERFIINNKIASPSDLVWAWGKLKPIIARMKKQYGPRYVPSYFEANVALAFLIFKKHHCTWIVLEVGCGGAFDATNIIPAPHITILTNVYLDHTELLGKTRSIIAQTKAGIIKPGSIVLTGESDPRIRKIIRHRARTYGDPFFYVRRPQTKQYILALQGEHQQHNAALAATTAELLHIKQKDIRSGLAATRLPARLEVMQKSPRVIIDGAHNPAKITALKKTIKQFPYSKLHVVIGVGENKPAQNMLRLLAPLCDSLIVTQARVVNPKPALASRLFAIAKKLGMRRVRNITPVRRAVAAAMKHAAHDDLILITGSLYLAGEARMLWIPHNHILTTGNLFPR